MKAFIIFTLVILVFVTLSVFDSDNFFSELISRGSLLAAIVVGCIACDQWSKYKKKLDKLLAEDEDEERKRRWTL